MARLQRQEEARRQERNDKVERINDSNARKMNEYRARRASSIRAWRGAVVTAGALFDGIVSDAPDLAFRAEDVPGGGPVAPDVTTGAINAYQSGLRCVPLCELAAVIGRGDNPEGVVRE